MFVSLKRLLPAEIHFALQLLVMLLWLAAFAIFLSGCSLIAPRVGPELAKGVTRYCAEPAAERMLVRESINAQIAPHRIELTCAGDRSP